MDSVCVLCLFLNKKVTGWLMQPLVAGVRQCGKPDVAKAGMHQYECANLLHSLSSQAPWTRNSN